MKKKHAGGRPSKITTIDLSVVKYYAQRGYTDKELALIFKVDRTTIINWKKKFPEFFNTLKRGKLIADSTIEVSLFERARGYSHPDVHISNYQGEITVTPIIKHYAPDTTACIIWLKNRKPAEWRDKVDVDHSDITHHHFFSEIEKKADGINANGREKKGNSKKG